MKRRNCKLANSKERQFQTSYTPALLSQLVLLYLLCVCVCIHGGASCFFLFHSFGIYIKRFSLEPNRYCEKRGKPLLCFYPPPFELLKWKKSLGIGWARVLRYIARALKEIDSSLLVWTTSFWNGLFFWWLERDDRSIFWKWEIKKIKAIVLLHGYVVEKLFCILLGCWATLFFFGRCHTRELLQYIYHRRENGGSLRKEAFIGRRKRRRRRRMGNELPVKFSLPVACTHT